MRCTDPAASDTGDPVIHLVIPKNPNGPAVSEISPKHCTGGLGDHLMDADRSAQPRAPSKKDLAPLDTWVR